MTDTCEVKRGSFLRAFVVGGLLSVLLCWLPLVGPFVAGVAGGRRGCRSATGAGAVVLIAALWAAGIALAGGIAVPLKGNTITLGAGLALPAICGPLLAGGLFGALGARAVAAWVLLLAVLGWAGVKGRDVKAAWDVVMDGPQQAYDETKNRGCPDNLKQLYAAVMNYADGWDGVLPPADHWLSAIRANVPNDAWLHCPSVKPGADNYGYAMNAALGGKRISDVPDRAKTPLFYDSTDLKPDAHDAFASLPKPGRHMGRDNVLFADGQVRSEAPK